MDGQWPDLDEPPRHGRRYRFAIMPRRLEPVLEPSTATCKTAIVDYQAQAWETIDASGVRSIVYVLHPATSHPSRTLERLVRGYKRPPEPEAQ